MSATALAFGLRAPPLLQRPMLQHARQIRHSRFSCTATPKKSVVFLGTPPVAARALEQLAAASHAPAAAFAVTGVVTQPPAPTGRKRQLCNTAVHKLAESLAIPTILTPASARDPSFLDAMRALAPDLCITAAYGNFLPRDFLSLPRHGTLNIHPSLLPAFRGAAPVARALEAGVPETGVSVLHTVLEMDAGPVVARRVVPLRGHEQAPQLLESLMDEGVDALLDVLPHVWDGSVTLEEQDHDAATQAPKLSKDEARISFTQNAVMIHNKVRALAGWPGTWADFVVKGKKDAYDVRLKIIETEVLRAEGGMCLGVHDVSFDEERQCLVVTCDDGSRIAVKRIQAPGKKPTEARCFWNGIRGKAIERKRVPH